MNEKNLDKLLWTSVVLILVLGCLYITIPVYFPSIIEDFKGEPGMIFALGIFLLGMGFTAFVVLLQHERSITEMNEVKKLLKEVKEIVQKKGRD